MHLTKYTDYALRTLIFLAAKDPDTATVSEIAHSYGISRNHLVKVVHHLSTNGLIRSERGRGGGIRLAIPADEIRVGDVVRLTEEDMALTECFNTSTNTCVIAGHCGLTGALNKAMGAFLKELDRYTLADVTGQKTSLGRILFNQEAGPGSDLR